MARFTHGGQDDLEVAHALLVYLSQGGAPQPIAAPFRLRPGEFAVASVDVVAHQVVEGDGTYVHKSGGYLGGGLLGLAALSAAKAVGNARRRAQAERRAAPAWRPIERGRMTLTDERIVLQGSQWVDLWHGALNVAERGPSWVELHYSGMAPLRLELPGPAWYQVMIQHLAWNDLPQLG